MNNLIIALVAWWFAEGLNFIQTIKHNLQIKRLKPFDCPMCLAFWIGVIYNGVTLKLSGNLVNDMFMVAVPSIISSVIAIFISKIYYRL